MSPRDQIIFDVRRAIREPTAYHEFVELFPWPEGPEEGLAIGDKRDVLLEAMLAYSLLAVRRLDDFLVETKRYPDDVIASDIGLDVRAILDGQERLLSDENRDLVNKSVAHLTARGLASTWDHEAKLTQILNEISGSLDRLDRALEASEVENTVC